LAVVEPAEPLEPGAPAFRLLSDCLGILSWEIES
jgi:hypothetical protein